MLRSSMPHAIRSSRRSRILSPVTMRSVIGGAAGLSVASRAFGQAPPDPLMATKLTANVVMISGDGGNKGLIISDNGLMMIDGGFANRAGELQTYIAGMDSHKMQILF